MIYEKCITPCHYVQYNNTNLVNFTTNGAYFWRKVAKIACWDLTIHEDIKFNTEKEIQAVITDDYYVQFHLILFDGPTCQLSGFSRSSTINPFKPPNLQQSGAGV